LEVLNKSLIYDIKNNFISTSSDENIIQSKEIIENKENEKEVENKYIISDDNPLLYELNKYLETTGNLLC
jgi:hypothetical protein